MKATASSGRKGTGASCAQSVSESGAGTLSAVILSLDHAAHRYLKVVGAIWCTCIYILTPYYPQSLVIRYKQVFNQVYKE